RWLMGDVRSQSRHAIDREERAEPAVVDEYRLLEDHVVDRLGEEVRAELAFADGTREHQVGVRAVLWLERRVRDRRAGRAPLVVEELLHDREAVGLRERQREPPPWPRLEADGKLRRDAVLVAVRERLEPTDVVLCDEAVVAGPAPAARAEPDLQL